MNRSAKSNPKTEPQILSSIQKGIDLLVSKQTQDGSWRGDYGGPMFLLPMYVAACYIAKKEIPPARKRGFLSYFRNVQNRDGGIGLHVEDTGSMFATSLSYAAMRMLGAERDDPTCAGMRDWIRTNGTALGSAGWGKFFLALLNLYPYEGLHPILPELWLLPYALPIHPGRMWCHCRQVYMPMAYLYGIRARIEKDDLIRELRGDLYDRPYERIDFTRCRDTIAPCDNRYPTSLPLRAVFRVMHLFERWHSVNLREKATSELYSHIQYEDGVTNYIDIGPVNSVLNTIAHHFKEPGGPESEKHFKTLESYLCEASDGIKFNGYNSTALWDTAFSTQAILASPFADRYDSHLKSAHRYIRDNQVIEDVPDRERFYRHASRGGWPFSDRAHGWPITDCTAEGFKSAIGLERFAEEPIDEELLKDSTRLILGLQNRDGGWATYEKQRSGAWLELLNSSQVFSDIMVDYSYVECTSACIQALARAKERFPGSFDRRIERAIRRGVRFIKRKQRPDGSWEGSWAVCFTYGTWFGTWGLLAGGVPKAAFEIRRACGFLIQRQNPDGGWGENHLSCVERRYVRHHHSTAVHTAWTLMTLVRAGMAHTNAANRAAKFLVRRQLENGDWPQEPLVGVFNKSTLINYEHYRRYFPIWALAEFERARSAVC